MNTYQTREFWVSRCSSLLSLEPRSNGILQCTIIPLNIEVICLDFGTSCIKTWTLCHWSLGYFPIFQWDVPDLPTTLPPSGIILRLVFSLYDFWGKLRSNAENGHGLLIRLTSALTTTMSRLMKKNINKNTWNWLKHEFLPHWVER